VTDDTELTADEARDLVDELGLDLYRAQDALAFVAECCDIADREQRPITTANVREWLKGARCARQLAADAAARNGASSPLRQQLAAALRSITVAGGAPPTLLAPVLTGTNPRMARIVDWQPLDQLIDAVLAVVQPGARITATLARMSEADVQRVIDLYERWCAAGPPPLGTSMSRWWDARLVELHNAIFPPEQQPGAGQTKEQ
jgi:hypothetical protein